MIAVSARNDPNKQCIGNGTLFPCGTADFEAEVTSMHSFIRSRAEFVLNAAAAAGSSAQHFNVGAQPVPQWWRLYGSDTLDSWIEEGLRNNRSLDAVRHTLEAAHQQFRAQVGGTLLPSIDAGGQVSRQRALGFPDFGPPTNLYDVFAGQLQLSYTFDLFGAVRYGVREAAAQVDSLNALARAQKLRDSSAQAIAMLAVARVVASNGVTR